MPTLSSTENEAVRREEGVASHLYLALESDRPAAGGLRLCLESIDEVLFRRGEARACDVDAGARRATLTLPDARVSSSHARLLRRDQGFVVEDTGSTNGTFVAGARIKSQPLASDEILQIGGAFLTVRVDEPTPEGTPTLRDTAAFRVDHPARATLIPRVASELASVVVIGAAKLSILVVGETGSGKEVLVRTLHEASGRTGPFVAVNCGAIPESLLEGHLFGHAKGSFSGATADALGLVRAADHGTLFLDEIGDLRPSSQAALLRVLQEREVLPVGGTRPVKVDVRVLSATHHRVDLEGERGAFRPDLYARLSGYVHRMLPLRERLPDLGVLIASVLARIDAERAPSIRLSPHLSNAMFRHTWPLNIRELHNLLEAAMILAPDGVLRREHAPQLGLTAAPLRSPAASARQRNDDEQTKRALLDALRAHHGNVSKVAHALGRTRMQIHRWMKRYGVDVDVYRR
jgi:DNA-binding NtrC family response regulator